MRSGFQTNVSHREKLRFLRCESTKKRIFHKCNLNKLFLICLILVIASFPLIPAYFYDGRQYRNDNNSHNQQFQILLYKWKIAEKITGITENTDPQSSPYQIIHHKIIIMHFTHTRNKRSKCTDYRYKTGNNDCLSSVFL